MVCTPRRGAGSGRTGSEGGVETGGHRRAGGASVGSDGPPFSRRGPAVRSATVPGVSVAAARCTMGEGLEPGTRPAETGAGGCRSGVARDELVDAFAGWREVAGGGADAVL